MMRRFTVCTKKTYWVLMNFNFQYVFKTFVLGRTPKEAVPKPEKLNFDHLLPKVLHCVSSLSSTLQYPTE